jgi:hypothetical protein
MQYTVFTGPRIYLCKLALDTANKVLEQLLRQLGQIIVHTDILLLRGNY